MMRQLLTTFAELVGVVSVIVGLFLLSAATGFIGGGAVLVAAGVLLAAPPAPVRSGDM